MIGQSYHCKSDHNWKLQTFGEDARYPTFQESLQFDVTISLTCHEKEYNTHDVFEAVSPLYLLAYLFV